MDPEEIFEDEVVEYGYYYDTEHNKYIGKHQQEILQALNDNLYVENNPPDSNTIFIILNIVSIVMVAFMCIQTVYIL